MNRGLCGYRLQRCCQKHLPGDVCTYTSHLNVKQSNGQRDGQSADRIFFSRGGVWTKMFLGSRILASRVLARRRRVLARRLKGAACWRRCGRSQQRTARRLRQRQGAVSQLPSCNHGDGFCFPHNARFLAQPRGDMGGRSKNGGKGEFRRGQQVGRGESLGE